PRGGAPRSVGAVLAGVVGVGGVWVGTDGGMRRTGGFSESGGAVGGGEVVLASGFRAVFAGVGRFFAARVGERRGRGRALGRGGAGEAASDGARSGAGNSGDAIGDSRRGGDMASGGTGAALVSADADCGVDAGGLAGREVGRQGLVSQNRGCGRRRLRFY